MYVKRALIAALEPPFYRDGLLQHTRTVSHTGGGLQQSARALVSHYGRPLQQTAAAFFFLTPAYRYSRLLQHGRTGYIRQLQQVAAAH
tara:strand:+ start:79 stop:342 length:264 start_codon:yes stop_codon:yes gene_type:complete